LTSVSFGFPVPAPVPLLIPMTAARVQAKVVPDVALVGLYENGVLLQMEGGVSVLVRVGVGFTMIVNDNGVPTHPLAVGVTMTVATTGAVPLLAAVNDGIFPAPLAVSPIDGVLFIQVKVVPVIGPLNVIAVVTVPLQ
jgi:hypothetical protein